MAWPSIKQEFSQEYFRRYVSGLSWTTWRPSKIVWHNTAAPSLEQWMKTAAMDAKNGRIPGSTRIGNLEQYWWKDRGWSGCPHLIIPNDRIWVMNPLTEPGVHSPSFNSTAIGIEMVGDFAREDDDAGEGLRVKRNTIFATSVLCSTLGLDPATSIYLHKQDPRTTHDCPGKDVADDKSAMIAEVSDLMSGGEHDPSEVAAVIETGLSPKSSSKERRGITTADELNLRRGPGTANESIGELPKGTVVSVLDEAKNATTAWLKVLTPAGLTGWVSGRYVKMRY